MRLPTTITTWTSKRLYQLPTSSRKTIPIYEPVEPVRRSRTIIASLSKRQLDEKLDKDRTRRDLFDKHNEARIKTGDIVRVLYKRDKCSFDNFIGYVLAIDRKRLPEDTSLLLRNKIGKTAVELRVPVFSPLIDTFEIVKRANGKRQRNKHYYIRDTRLDVGELEALLRKNKS